MAPSRQQFVNAVVEKANRQMATIGNTSNNSVISSIAVPLVPQKTLEDFGFPRFFCCQSLSLICCPFFCDLIWWSSCSGHFILILE